MAEELKLVITVDKEGAIAGIKQVRDEEDKLKDKTKETSFFFTELNSALSLVTIGYGALKEAIKGGIDIIKEGSKIDDVTQAFNRLSTQAGATADTFLSDLNAATGQTISNFALMRQANEALQKGLTPDQFFQISAAARELSETMGTDLLTEIQQISQAFETGNIKILQNRLGVIDLKAAEEELAASLGIKREALTREQQVLAARTAIMAAARDEAERGLSVESDSADIIDQVAKGFNDQANEIKKVIAAYPQLNSSLASFRDLMKQINWTGLATNIAAFASVVIDSFNVIIRSILDAKKNFQLFQDYLSLTFGTEIDKVSDKAAGLREQFIALTRTLPATKENIQKVEQVLIDLGQEMIDARKAAIETGAVTFDELQENISETNEEFRGLLTQFEDFKNTVSTPVDIVIRAPKMPPIPTIPPPKITPGTGTNKGGFSGVDTGIEHEPGASGKPSWFDRTFGTDLFSAEDTARITSQVEQSIGDAVARGLNLAFSGGNREDWKQVAKDTGSQIGSAIGMTWGPIGGALGGFVGEKLGKGISDAITHMFGGGRDPGTKARKNIEAWFDNLLKDSDLRIIKDDQLIDLKEFDRLGDAFEEDWGSHFREIAGESANTFSAIGQGLTGIIGVAEDFGSQIAYIMAENLGGSLNNLQLMFYKTGLSVEELRGQLLDAFMDGKLSADDFMGALAGINQVMTQGIPDGVGMTSAALDNLFASSGRGIASLDALRDIFIEAGEVGITSFEGLRENLIAAGQSAEQVDALFKVLSDAGIGSFEQVLEGSDEFLIGLIANLDDAGFQFAELNQTIDDLGQKLDDLERGRDIDITLNVRTNADASSQRLIDAGALPGVA